MLALEDARWKTLPSCSGGAKTVSELLAVLYRGGDLDQWNEAWEQIAHQWTRYPAAYAALPHLVDLRIRMRYGGESEFLVNAARVAMPLEVVSPCPSDLAADFEGAIDLAGRLGTSALRNRHREPSEFTRVLCATAAITGRPSLGRLTLSAECDATEVEVACLSCGEAPVARYDSAAGSMTVTALDAHGRARSGSTLVDAERAPRHTDELAWALEACAAAMQPGVARWVSLLFGRAACPTCGVEFVPAERAGGA